MAIPDKHYGRVAPHSGLAVKHSIDVGTGIIDSDYRRPIKILLFNFSSHPFSISIGDRIAQLIITPYLPTHPITTTSLDSTLRDSSGFGSTGSGVSALNGG